MRWLTNGVSDSEGMVKKYQTNYYVDEGCGVSTPKMGGLGGNFWEENWVEYRILEISAGKPKSVIFERREGEYYGFGSTEKHTFCQYRIDFEDVQLIFQPSCWLLDLGNRQYITLVFKQYLFRDNKDRSRRYNISYPHESDLRHFHFEEDIFIIRNHKPLLRLMKKLDRADLHEHWKYRNQCHFEEGNNKAILEDIKSWAMTGRK